MGIYVNPGNENFRRTIAADIYVDKTMLLDVTNRSINKGNNYVCVSGPRRFGKNIAGNMLCSYYSRGYDSREKLSRFKTSGKPGYEENLNRYNVIKIDMNGEYQNAADKNQLIHELTSEIKCELEQVFFLASG